MRHFEDALADYREWQWRMFSPEFEPDRKERDFDPLDDVEDRDTKPYCATPMTEKYIGTD